MNFHAKIYLFSVGAFTNLTQDSDAYFVKVIVLTGQCYHDCSQNKIEVPYGTNFPGQTVCYRTQRPGLEEGFGQIESCAPQLTQTAHTALQLPYTIFGLGLAPNFLDYMFVKVTNATDHSRSHTWSQVGKISIFVQIFNFVKKNQFTYSRNSIFVHKFNFCPHKFQISL